MRDADRHKLHHGPYAPTRCRVGDGLPCEYRGREVVEGGITDAPIQWPYRKGVLRPGGRFLFLEHGLAESPGVQKWQRRLNPFQRLLADGCRLDLDVPALVGGQPFGDLAVERFEMKRGPRTHGTMYRGIEVK